MPDQMISNFFSQAGACTTQTECDAFASSTFGGPVTPVPDQGAWSYTVTAGADSNTIVQFREPDSPLDVETLATAHSIHPALVVACVAHGTIGSPAGLLVYSTRKLPGETYFGISAKLGDTDFIHRFTTVLGLAECVYYPAPYDTPSPLTPFPTPARPSPSLCASYTRVN